MKNKININGYDISKTQIDATEYTITAFHSEKFEFQFNVFYYQKVKTIYYQHINSQKNLIQSLHG
jgi:hypothetical protein